MPQCACASDVYGIVFVCLCVCVDCYSCARINEVQVRVSIGFFLVMLIRGFAKIIMLCSRVMPSFTYLECHCSLFRTCSLNVATPLIIT